MWPKLAETPVRGIAIDLTRVGCVLQQLCKSCNPRYDYLQVNTTRSNNSSTWSIMQEILLRAMNSQEITAEQIKLAVHRT
jgi:hypothetical protein